MKTLIIGLGNPILRDDGVGIRVANEIRRRLPKSSAIEIVETSSGALALLDLICGYDKVVIIDSIKTENHAPGELHKLRLEDLGSAIPSVSSHRVDLRTAIELGKKLGYKLPKIIDIYAIEVKDNTTFCEELTPAIEAKISSIVTRIMNDIN